MRAWLIVAALGVGPAVAWLSRAWDATARRTRAGEAAALAAAALLIALAASFFAPERAALAALLGWALLALAAVDARHGLLPDALTLPLIVAGLAASAWEAAGPPYAALAGAAAGWAAFAALASLYERLSGREGLGGGDAKLLAAGGAWLGWAALPFVVALASCAALAAVALGALLGRAAAREREIAFGPYLSFGVWLLYLYDASRLGR